LSIEEVDFDEDDFIESKNIDPMKTNEKIVKVWNHDYMEQIYYLQVI
jgi:hypothetical protein